MNRISAGPVLAYCPATPRTPTARVRNHRRVVAWYAAFAGFACVVFATSGEPVQQSWAAWAAGGYAFAALTAALWRSRGRGAALVIGLAGALGAPLVWQVTFGSKMSRVGDDSLQVVDRSALLLLRHGTPYLPADQISHAVEYNPYEPAMATFGLPAALGLHGAAGNPRLWMGITAAAVLATAFRLAKPGSALRSTAFAFGSPVLALPLMQGLTDLPVVALLSLTLACITTDTRRRIWLAGAIALGAACAMKATAWPALPVIVAMLAARDGARTATKFAVTAGLTMTALVAATAPASVTAPAALFLNTVLFPLGMTRYQTDADSPLPGHLLAAATGSAGHWAAIGLLFAASLAVAVSLVVRPPADTQAVAWRLAVNLAILFTLAPASRWGYFVYPAALLGFVSMTRSERGPWGAVPQGSRQRADALRRLRRGVDLTPQRVEGALPTCRDVPGVVSAVVPRPDATGTVALARKLDPEVAID
jgi:hypothetical protein